MKLTKDEKQKRLEALKELLSEEDTKVKPSDDEEEEEKTKQQLKDSKEMDDDDEWDENDDEDEMEDSDDEDEMENDDDDEGKKMKKESQSYQKHLDAMFEGSDLSKETKEKIKVLFEAAVGYETNKRVSKIKEKLEEDQKKAVAEIEKQLKEDANAYLSYVVEEWTSKNEVALKQQIKLDIMESFISGLRQLFLEHNINVPEGKESLVDELMEKISYLENDVKNLSKKNVKLQESLDQTKRQLILKNYTEGMTALNAEKLKSLVESKNFDSIEEFEKGVALIKESYFKKEEVKQDEEKQIVEQKNEIPENIKAYAEVLTKFSKK
jgi:hypothetical protein